MARPPERSGARGPCERRRRGVRPPSRRRRYGEPRRSSGGGGRGEAPRFIMFSPALEIVLTVAYREAATRRHAHLTLEHLLYALAHDPDGERNPRRVRRRPAEAPAGPRRLPRRGRSRSSARARSAEPEQTLGVPARAADRRPPRPERGPRQRVQRRRHARGDPAAAEDVRRAAARARRESRASTCSNYISHGITKAPPGAEPGGAPDVPGRRAGERGAALDRARPARRLQP